MKVEGRQIFWLCLALILLGICLRLRFTDASSAGREGQSELVHRMGMSFESKEIQRMARSTESDSGGAKKEASSNSLSILDKIKLSVDSDNIPIDFEGIVLDENEHPLPGVNVGISITQASVTEISSFTRTNTKRTLTSDQKGLFAIHGVKGQILTINEMRKDRYQLADNTKTSYGYNTAEQFRYMPGKSIIFRMWRSRGAEFLLTGNPNFGIIPDARTYTLNLITGNKHESSTADGDLRVSIVRPTEIVPRKAFDWSARISAVDGGIMITTNTINNIAPTNGYSPAITISEFSNDPNWSDRVVKSVVFYSRNGSVFGRAELEIFGIFGVASPSAIRCQYFINTNSSRNLEYDKLKSFEIR